MTKSEVKLILRKADLLTPDSYEQLRDLFDHHFKIKAKRRKESINEQQKRESYLLFKFDFGVYCKGEIVFLFNTIECTHFQAEVIVSILNLAKDVLDEYQYFACDYYKRELEGD